MRFTVPGAPVPKGRPRTTVTRRGKVHTYTPARTQAFEELVAWCARTALTAEDSALWDGDVSVRIWFYMPDKRRRDADNLAKGVLDSINNVVFKDDTQVKHLEIWKLLDRENPRTEIEVTEWET